MIGLILAITTLTPTARAASQAAPPNSMAARYTLAVTVDDEKHTVSARETVEATNRTGSPLTSLVFNVTPRHVPGFEMGQVTVNGAVLQPHYDDVVMEVPLPTPLPPDKAAKVEMSFREVLPVPGDMRYGYDEGILALGNWFPILAVYRHDGWDRHHYSPVGDPFFTETADYDVTVKADPHLVIAHTGTLTKYKDGTWEIKAVGVRDFAMAMSRKYESHSANVLGTKITAYYLPDDKTGGLQAFEYAQQAFTWYVEHLGPYGYPSFEVAETSSRVAADVGQEYPNLIFLSTAQVRKASPPGYYLTYLVAHETGHQWLYGLVGNDHVREPWLDEGPVVHLSYQFVKDRYPSAYAKQWAQVQSDYEKAVATWGQKPLDSTESDFSSPDQYYGLLYRGSALFLDRLMETMGTDNYIAFLRDYVSSYRGSNATTSDFLLLAERYAGHDLSDLYRQSFRPASYIPSTPTPSPTAQTTVTVAPTRTAEPPPSPTATTVRATATAVPTSTPRPTTASSSTPTATTAVPTVDGLNAAVRLVMLSGVAGLALVSVLSYLLIRRS